MWVIHDGKLTNSEFIPLPINYLVPPYPDGTWLLKDSELKPKGMIENIHGACCYCYDLETVVIPATVKVIGDYAFYYTKIKQVKIARDCVYGKHSFPVGCEIKYY